MLHMLSHNSGGNLPLNPVPNLGVVARVLWLSKAGLVFPLTLVLQHSRLQL